MNTGTNLRLFRRPTKIQTELFESVIVDDTYDGGGDDNTCLGDELTARYGSEALACYHIMDAEQIGSEMGLELATELGIDVLYLWKDDAEFRAKLYDWLEQEIYAVGPED